MFNPLEQANARIEKLRKARATVRVVDASGKPLPRARVSINQTRHAFLFGCNLYQLFEYQGDQHERYAELFTRLFNYATLPFYWGGYEFEQGKPQRENLERLARWCQQRKITTKGHPLVWHEVYPRWAPNDVATVRPMLLERIRTLVSQFRGLIDIWDVVNEVTVSERFDNGVGRWVKQVGMVPMVAECLETARATNRRARLLYNDFNISPEFEQVVQGLVERRAPLDAVGIQSHMHWGDWTMERTWEVCETYARFGKPLHFTEISIISGVFTKGEPHPRPWNSTPEGEARQAEMVEKFYTVLFSHPAVEAITWWDLPDGQWLGAPSGLVRADLSPKPAYERLAKKIKGDWWTTTTLTTDAQGRASFSGFKGDYKVTVQVGRQRIEREFNLTQNTTWQVQLR